MIMGCMESNKEMQVIITHRYAGHQVGGGGMVPENFSGGGTVCIP